MNKLATFFVAVGFSAIPIAADTPYVGPVWEPLDLQPEQSVFGQQGVESHLMRDFAASIDFEDFLRPEPPLAMIAFTINRELKPWKEFAVKLVPQNGRLNIAGVEMAPTMADFEDLDFQKSRLDEYKRQVFAVTDRQIAERQKAFAASRDRLAARQARRKLVECSVPIDLERGNRIEAVWMAMLVRTRYPEAGRVDLQFSKTIDRDPLEYHFLGHDLVGRAESPATGFRPAALVALGTAMLDYCKTKQGEALARMDIKLVELEGLLAKDGVKP